VHAQRTDFFVGLFLLVTVGVLVGMGIVTSGLGEKRIDVYMRAGSAQSLSRDTRVVLGGLPIGRVGEISPLVDSATGSLSFVARLSLQERFPDGTRLVLPAGTRAVISQPNPLAPAQIDLTLPDVPAPGRHLEPGDTVGSERPRSVMDALPEIAEDLRTDLRGVLADTRALLERSGAAVDRTHRLVNTTGPLLTDVLQRLAGTLERTDTLLAAVTPRVAPLHDSVTLVLSDTRRTLARADTLLGLTGDFVTENRVAVRELSDRLLRAAAVLEHFSDQVSRRPFRLLTGVRPPPEATPPDTTRGGR
jgi:ABC-type transporter Mla subunit MlaD